MYHTKDKTMQIINGKLLHVKAEGDLIMEYEPKELYLGETSLNPESTVRLISYIPDYILKEAKRNGLYVARYNPRMDILMNPHDIWLEYEKNKNYIEDQGSHLEYLYPQ